MVTVDHNKCTQCSICITNFRDYCISEQNGFPVIDYAICNQCQKCIAICPQQAFTMNRVAPLKIAGVEKLGYEELVSFLRLRRSIKKFIQKDIPADIIEKIARSAKYAPNQNKNIDILIIDDPQLIQTIDAYALHFVKRWYVLLFKFKPATWFFSLFAKSLPVVKKKMELDLKVKQRVVKENTNVLLVALGNPKVPVTELSAQYLLGTMILTAQSLDVGSTLMDSLKLTFNLSKQLKKQLGISKTDKVLGVLALGYTGEKIVNIPQGYEIKLHWNKMNE